MDKYHLNLFLPANTMEEAAKNCTVLQNISLYPLESWKAYTCEIRKGGSSVNLVGLPTNGKVILVSKKILSIFLKLQEKADAETVYLALWPNHPEYDVSIHAQPFLRQTFLPGLTTYNCVASGSGFLLEAVRAQLLISKHHHALIHGALNYAVDKNLIPSNPADRIIISKPEPFKGDYYLDSEVLNLFEVIKGHKIELVVLLTAFYGLRRSEVIGLKWSAFDFNHNCFSIRHTVTTCNVKGERVTIKKDKAKNKSSLRTYPLIPFLKERLLEAKKQQEENRKLCGRSYNKEYLGYVCVDVIGNLIKPNYVSSTFGKLLAKNNLRHIRFHDLRHTCASLLLANGVPMEQVKEWLGHSEISTTVDIYGHLQYATKKQSAAAIEQDIVAPMLQNLSAVSP